MEIGRPDKFFRAWSDKLRNEFAELQIVGFSNTTKVAGQRQTWELFGNAPSTAWTPKVTYNVFRFFPSGSNWTEVLYWLGVRAQIVVAGREKYAVEQVSMVVFRGLFSDQQKTALLRAEWDEFDTTSSLNAQPHWHVYRSEVSAGTVFEARDSRTRDFVSPRPEGQFTSEVSSALPVSEASGGWLKAHRFHFAMAARWHSADTDSHKEQLTEPKLFGWLTGCISYTYRQLESLYGK